MTAQLVRLFVLPGRTSWPWGTACCRTQSCGVRHPVVSARWWPDCKWIRRLHGQSLADSRWWADGESWGTSGWPCSTPATCWPCCLASYCTEHSTQRRYCTVPCSFSCMCTKYHWTRNEVICGPFYGSSNYKLSFQESQQHLAKRYPASQ